MWSDVKNVSDVGGKPPKNNNSEILCDLKEEMRTSLLAGFLMTRSDSCENLYDSFKSDVSVSFQILQITLTET